MIRTITIDIINEKALKLLQDLELMKLIRLRRDATPDMSKIDWKKKYKGSVTSQSKDDIDDQLKELRSEWD